MRIYSGSNVRRGRTVGRWSLGTFGLAGLLLAAVALLAVAAIVIYDQLDSHGLTHKRLNRIAAKCEQRARECSTRDPDRYEDGFDGCEEVEKSYRNRDPLPPRRARLA